MGFSWYLELICGFFMVFRADLWGFSWYLELICGFFMVFRADLWVFHGI